VVARLPVNIAGAVSSGSELMDKPVKEREENAEAFFISIQETCFHYLFIEVA
jgi:hypothetical protein